MRLIDLREHLGVHPGGGAADVLPVVPLGGATLEQAAEGARAAGARVRSGLRGPVYLYGAGGGGRTPAAYAPPSAAGRILEARLAAAGARQAAAAALARGGEETARLAPRLQEAAGELAATGAGQADFLAAAEAAAAVPRVLDAGNVEDAEARALLLAGAHGLRRALGSQIVAARAERIRLLDRWLG